jgi:ribose transport system substrate-binding protein
MSRRLWAVTGLALIAVATAMAAVASGSTAAHKKTLTIYLIPGISTDPFYLTMKKGAVAEAKKDGVNLIYQGAPNAFSPATQIPILNAAIARHPDAIVIAPTDKTALIAPLKKAIAAGIPVITVDTFITAPIAVTNVSSDNLKGGNMAGEALANLVGKKGKVAGISVEPGISTTDQRRDGFASKIKTYKGIKYLGTQYDHDDQTKAAQITSALLTANPDLKGIFAMNVVTADGVSTAVKESGSTGLKVVEFDAGPDQVHALKAKTVDALIAQDPFTIGTWGIHYAYLYATGHRTGIAKHYGTGAAIITRANVNNPKFKKFLYTK